MRIKFMTASLIALASLAQSSFASPVDIFFSTTAFPTTAVLSPTVPTLNLTGGQQATLYIWAKVNNTQDVMNVIGLDINADTRNVVSAVSDSAANPSWTVSGRSGSTTYYRWDAALGGTLNASTTTLDRNMQYVAVTAAGLNNNNLSDPGWDNSSNGASGYLGSLTLQGVNGANGTTHLKFAVSSLTMSYTSTSPDVGTQNVLFGTDTAPVSGITAGGTGTGYDATINVTSVPEPAAFGIGLLTLGAMFIGYRRQHAQA